MKCDPENPVWETYPEYEGFLVPKHSKVIYNTLRQDFITLEQLVADEATGWVWYKLLKGALILYCVNAPVVTILSFDLSFNRPVVTKPVLPFCFSYYGVATFWLHTGM